VPLVARPHFLEDIPMSTSTTTNAKAPSRSTLPSTLPFELDRITQMVTLPGVFPSQLDTASAISITQACEMMRGRGGRRVSVQVARRWASPLRGWHCTVDGVGYRMLLPVVKLSGELVTMAEWVRRFELARVRLSPTTA
jgi:hypothetical protein